MELHFLRLISLDSLIKVVNIEFPGHKAMAVPSAQTAILLNLILLGGVSIPVCSINQRNQHTLVAYNSEFV